jgi:hypothetical protein
VLRTITPRPASPATDMASVVALLAVTGTLGALYLPLFIH